MSLYAPVDRWLRDRRMRREIAARSEAARVLSGHAARRRDERARLDATTRQLRSEIASGVCAPLGWRA